MEGKTFISAPLGITPELHPPKIWGQAGDIHWEETRPSAGRMFNILGQFHSSQLLRKLIIALKIKLWASSGPHFLPGHAERGSAAPGRGTRALCSPKAFPWTQG